MDWTAVVDFAVGLAQIALCGLLAYGAVLAVIASFFAKRIDGKRRVSFDRLRPFSAFGRAK